EFRNKAQNKPPVFSDVGPTLKKLKKNFDLFVLTKGNIEEQKRKVETSELSDYFDEIFVVSEKNDQTYKSISDKYHWQVDECCMVGNSPKSDINPALRLGMYAIFIPYPYTWKLDNEAVLEGHPNLYTVKAISSVPKLLDKITR
ncbi:HAD hydrolase-like protein, partial [Calditrichota bacterium]